MGNRVIVWLEIWRDMMFVSWIDTMASYPTMGKMEERKKVDERAVKLVGEMDSAL